jgi:DNA-directed RNA polymerase subunit RPC12/RpoP
MGIFDWFRGPSRQASIGGSSISGGPSITGDTGPEVIDFLVSSIGVDTQWSLREPRGFTWWGHHFAQRVWAEPIRVSHGHEIVQVHASTAVLRGVPDSPQTRRKVALLNRYASLSAWAWSPADERLFLRAVATFHRQNVGWLKSFFLAAVGLQAADAHIKAHDLAKLMGGEPDASAHPEHGPRPEPDEILEIIATRFAPAGAGTSPFTEVDFQAAAEVTPRPWVTVFSGASGLTGQLPFTGSTPAELSESVETALLNIENDQRHPQLGAGALLTLRFPIRLTQDEAASAAWTLNRGGTQVPTHTLGAWTVAPETPGHPPMLAFCSFVPALLYKPGLLPALVMEMAARARWFGVVHLHSRSPRVLEQMLQTHKSPTGLEKLQRVSVPGWDEARRLQSSALEVRCWSCKEPLPVTPETRGKKIRCPRCRTKQELPL